MNRPPGAIPAGWAPATPGPGTGPPPPWPTWTAPASGAAPTRHDGVDAELHAAPDLGRAERTSTKRRLIVRPSGRGAILVAFAATTVWLIVSLHALLAVALALVFAVAADAWIALRSVTFEEIEAVPTGSAVADEPTRWRLRIDDLKRPVAVHPVRWPVPPDVLVDHPDAGVVTLPPTPRGIVHFLILDAWASGPLGLCRAARRFRATPPRPIVVGPRSIPLHVRWPLPRAVAYGLSEVAPRGDDLFRGVRPYQRGDERRKIHWKATARTNELMVREDDGTGIVALQIAVDLGPPGPVNEHIVANAAWLAEAAVQRGWIVQLVTLDDTPDVPVVPDLGKPLSFAPRTLPALPRPVQVLAQEVAGPEAIHRQLATAAPGQPQVPRWVGLSCRVTGHGVIWP